MWRFLHLDQGNTMSSAGYYGDRDIQHYPGRASIIFNTFLFVFIFKKILIDSSGSPAERLSAMNAARSVDQRAQPMFEFAPKANEDVFFDLIEQDKIAYGQPFSVTVQIQNRSSVTYSRPWLK